MDRNNESANQCKHSGHRVWKLVGGVALAVVAAGLIASMGDIRRYIRITRM